jgi:hypothetical protein
MLDPSYREFVAPSDYLASLHSLAQPFWPLSSVRLGVSLADTGAGGYGFAR